MAAADFIILLEESCLYKGDNSTIDIIYIYQPLRSSRIWHKVNF